MNAAPPAQSTESSPPPAVYGAAAPPPRTRAIFPWAWTALACALLVASGFVRGWQGKRLEIPSEKIGPPPFALKSIPTTLGNWKILEGSDRKLDPQVALVSGCTDHLIREYYDVETGCVITLLLGYGPAERVYGHSPEICFPASGYQPVADSIDGDVPWVDGQGKSQVRSGIYASDSQGGLGIRLEAYYALRHAGRWTSDVDYKAFRKEPAMYRILIQRRVLESETREAGNPSEQFLAELFPEIERRIAGPASAPSPSIAATP